MSINTRGLVFDQNGIAANHPNRSTFLMPSTWQGSMDAGLLYPIYTQLCLPGDYTQIKCGGALKMPSPLIRSLMDDMQCELFAFFVPCRILWKNFKRMFGEVYNPTDSIEYDIPQWAPPAGGWTTGKLADAFGLPLGADGITVSVLPQRAYRKIWDDWFRNETLQNSTFTQTSFEFDSLTTGDTDLLYINKRGDYFTRMLPWPQKGDAVTLNVGGQAPVWGNNNAIVLTDNNGTRSVVSGNASSNMLQHNVMGANQLTGTVVGIAGDSQNLQMGFITEDEADTNNIDSYAYADMSSATGIAINDLRDKIAIQKYLELNARGGTRYTEYILNHYGIHTSDARLQYSEFLGSAKFNINIHNIPQMSQTTTGETDASPQGFETATGDGIGSLTFDNAAEEFGYLMIMATVRNNNKYQQCVEKHWLYKDRLDFPDPIFAHLGEQAVTGIELYAQDGTVDTGTTGTPDNKKILGYQERYAERRNKRSLITGILRSQADTPLDNYHLAEKIHDWSQATLTTSFLSAKNLQDTLDERILAIPSEPAFIANFYFEEKTTTCLPTYGTPAGLMGGF